MGKAVRKDSNAKLRIALNWRNLKLRKKWRTSTITVMAMRIRKKKMKSSKFRQEQRLVHQWWTWLHTSVIRWIPKVVYYELGIFLQSGHDIYWQKRLRQISVLINCNFLKTKLIASSSL